MQLILVRMFRLRASGSVTSETGNRAGGCRKQRLTRVRKVLRRRFPAIAGACSRIRREGCRPAAAAVAQKNPGQRVDNKRFYRIYTTKH
jgi:hypothetical protein